ncbi:HlyD family secretion protein [Vibrio algivorus]|uniref:HlyD family secretion protein n=1 Tax=Vibrio algivorus TaxID=1667024 RepID=UPI000B5CBFB8|nr:HlyD family efflux transporter periplasmic adaptor subunit [Vibrio algivorus]
MVKRIGAFVIVILGVLISGCSPQDSTQASGTLERERISLLSTASEIIIELPVKEGSKVEKGQLLLQLDNKNQKAILAKARAELAQAKANLTKMSNGERVEDIDAAKANLANAKAKLIDAQKHYTRMSELLGKKLVSISERDNALAERDATKATYDSAYQTWQKLTKGNRVEDIESAQAQLAAAKAEVVLQRHKLDELSIIATRDGILDSLPYHLGERVPDRAVVAIVQANAKPYARVYMPEPYKHKIHAGVSLNVHIDGVDEAMKGTVRWISVEPAFTPYRTMTEEDRSRLVYLTEIDLPEAANSLPAGIPLQVDLEGI